MFEKTMFQDFDTYDAKTTVFSGIQKTV